MFSSPLDDDDGDFMSPPTRSSSKLASLFGQDKASFSGGNESLTYTPPKQPKKEKPAGQSQGGGGETTLLCATAVHAYKYVNGQYASQGKLGAAILANHAANDYRILIYASKQQQVTTGKINGNFSFTVQGSNYASFYDDQRQTWSLCFDSDKSITNFAKQVGLSKFNSSSTSLCTQDLVPGEGLAIEFGDALEVKYTGWLWKNNNFGSVFDGNVETDKTFKFKTGKGKVIKGWEQGVIGMKKGSKRLIAIPSPLAYGEKGVSGRVPPNSSLLFEVEVLRIKSSRESTESPVTIQEGVNPQSSDQLPDILSEPSGTRKRSMDSVSQLSAPGDSGIKGRTASITEQLSQSPEKGTDKARLLARMSKMGKNPLSLPGAVVAEPENDDLVEADQEVPPSPQPVVQDTRSGTSTESPPDISSNPHPSPRVKPQPPPRPVQVHPEVQQTLHNPTPGMHNPTPGMQPIMNHQPMISPQHVMNPQPVIQPAFTPQQQVALYQPPTSSMGYPMMAPQPQIITAAPYSVPPPPPPPPQPQPTANDAMVPVLMAETRQQQGEIRMSIAKLSDKIDELSNKVDRQHQSSVQVANQLSPANQMGVSAYGNPQAVMEASILVHNITRIVQENEKLKVESTEKTKKIEVLNDKISELLQKSQRFVEHSNTMLEQRSDSLQVNTAQSQARVLSLEQEKISMSGELTTAKTQLAALLNEVTSLRQREAEVSSQLSKVTSEAEKFKNELERTKDSHTESAEQSERLKQSLKEEKQTRKQFETKVEHMEEELNDLRNEKESLEKVLGERKKKHAADKKKCEEELEELRSQQEEEIKFLKEKHKKEKQSSGTATAQQVAQAEAELEERWSEKAERMVAQTEQKWKRRLQEVTDEREEANKKLLELQGKYSAMKASEDSKEEKIKDLGDKLEDLEGIQEKYAQLQASNVDKESEVDALRSTKQELESLQTKYQEVRSRTLKMKEQYEEQLNTAEEERESAVSEAYAKGLREGKVQGGGNTQESSVNVNDEVKRIMNTVFYMLRNEFEAGESYSGADIMNVVLKTIKEVTMKLLSGKPAEKEESEEEEEEEEEDDENEDEDENEDVKVEIEEKEVSKEEDEKVEEKEELKVEQEEVTQGEGDSGKVGNNKDAEEEFGENSQKEVLEEVDKGESGDEDTSAEKDTEESEFLRGIPDANVETKSVEKESSQVNLETSSEDRADEKDSPSLGNTINSVPLQGNEIDVRSLEEPSAAVTDENSRTEVDRTSSEFATSLRVENEEGSPFDGLIGEESQPTTEAEEKEESFFDAQEEPVKAGTQMDSSKTTDISEDKLKSLFGDDDHDDVEATFGSLTKKKEKEEHLDTSPLRAVPPPLFDDDDDDDLDWFK